jgi:hypothetical protein
VWQDTQLDWANKSVRPKEKEIQRVIKAVKIETREGALWINICSSYLNQFRVINGSQLSIHGLVSFKETMLGLH